jgi:hypothetical protein
MNPFDRAYANNSASPSSVRISSERTNPVVLVGSFSVERRGCARVVAIIVVLEDEEGNFADGEVIGAIWACSNCVFSGFVAVGAKISPVTCTVVIVLESAFN